MIWLPVCPVFHEYELAPEAVSVAWLPAHIVPLAMTDTVVDGETFTGSVCVLVQPLKPVPTTV
jgi:hypothetical protein